MPPAERAAYLDRACDGNDSLRQVIESLIASHEETGNFVDKPAFQAAAEMFVDKLDFAPGQQVAHYRIVSKIGEGGMGQVYLAEDTKLNRKESLKQIFEVALGLAPAERSAYLDRVCDDNASLRQAVDSLIRSHEDSTSFVDKPAYQAAAEMLVTNLELTSGQQVAHYKIISKIGEGGIVRYGIAL